MVSRGGRDSPPHRQLSRVKAAESRAVEIARGRRGIVLLDELLDVGLTKHAVARRVETGWLTRHHERIYSVGPLDPVGLIQAGLLACDEEATAWGRSAAALHRLLPFIDAVWIAVPRGSTRPPGLDIVEQTQMPKWTRREGLRTTTVPETLLALAATATYAETQRAFDQAHIDRRITTASLAPFLIEKSGRRGVRTLRAIAEGPATRSHAERTFYELLKLGRLDLPLVNVMVNGVLVDFYWPEHNLIVETDGWASHQRQSQRERDGTRDLDHFAAGVETLRITARKLEREPYAVLAALAAGLSRRASGR